MRRVPFHVYAMALVSARAESSLVERMTSHPTELPAEAEFYLSDTNRAGFLVTDEGMLCGLFSLDKGQGDALMVAAIDAGANILDCFDGYLPEFYARHGFVVTAREPNWTEGGPDVLVMARGDRLANVA